MGDVPSQAERIADEELAREELELRRDEMTPRPPGGRTPRERTEAFVISAAGCLCGAVDIASALRLLDQALEVLRNPQVIDGAALVALGIERALDRLEAGDAGSAACELGKVREVLWSNTRTAGRGGVVSAEDFVSSAPSGQRFKREALRAVMLRHRLEAWGGQLSDATLDEMVAAVEQEF